MRTYPQVIDDLEINEVRDGMTVYDPASDRIHYLNSTAAIVFTLCDGQHSAGSIADFLADAFELGNPPISEVESCLRMLESNDLLL